MKTSTSTLNPFAVAYVPVAKLEVQDLEKECKSVSGDAVLNDFKKLSVDQINGSHGAPADIQLEMDANVLDVQSEMDLAYLQMTFPGISVQFLVDVYSINGGDLEAAIDMITELESTDDKQHPLNNDNTLEPVTSGECSSAKNVLVSGESYCSAASINVTAATPSHANQKTDKSVVL